MGKLKVLISVPNTGYIHKECVFALLKMLMDNRYHLTFILPTNSPFENNLHHIVKDFYEGDYDFWLSFDSDNPPVNNPLDLVEFDRDIISCPTPVWNWLKKGERPIYWNSYKTNGDAYNEWPDKEGLQKVDAFGTGCFLVARRVFENAEMRKAPFSRKLYPDGRVEKGNDIMFSERARAQGFEIYAHYDYHCKHYKELELTDVIKAHWNGDS